MDKYLGNIFLWDKPKVQKLQKMWKPHCNVYEDKDTIHIVFELPGVDKHHISLSFENEMLILSGHRDEFPKPTGKKGIAYHILEINNGNFERKLKITIDIDVKNISAEYKEGFLTVILPKLKEKKKDKTTKVTIT